MMAPLLRPGAAPRPDAAARVLVSAATALLLAVAIGLYVAGQRRRAAPYLLGNWPAPFGIVLVLDRLSALMLLLDRRPGAGRGAGYAIGRLGPTRPALPRAVPVPADGRQRRLPDRRRVQPVRLLRGAADRLLRADAAWRRRRAGCSAGFHYVAINLDRLDAVPVRGRPDLRASPARSTWPTWPCKVPQVAARRPGAARRPARCCCRGVRHQGGAGAAALVAAHRLCRDLAARGRPVRDHDQGRRLLDHPRLHADLRRRRRRRSPASPRPGCCRPRWSRWPSARSACSPAAPCAISPASRWSPRWARC